MEARQLLVLRGVLIRLLETPLDSITLALMASDFKGTTLRRKWRDPSRCGHDEARLLKTGSTSLPGSTPCVGLPELSKRNGMRLK